MLEASNLTCTRGGQTLFSGVNFRLDGGQLMYLRGANGAGKTSLLRLLCGLSRPEEGQVLWNGAPIAELGAAYLRILLYVGHHNALQEALTVQENLAFYAALSGATFQDAAISDVLAKLGLRGCLNRAVRQLSQGQKRRVALSRLMLQPAQLWILDEPFVALDPEAVVQLTTLLSRHVADGGSVMLTSHQQVDIGASAPQFLDLGK